VQSDAGVPYDAGKPDNLKTSYRAGEPNKLQEVAELLLANNPSGLGTRHRLPSMAHRRARAHMLGNEDFHQKAKKMVSQGMMAGLAASAMFGSNIQGAQAGPFTQTELNSLTYEQIKGTGLANTCPSVEGEGDGKISTSGLKRLSNLCLEPLVFAVEEDGKFETSKVTTRQTYTLTGIEGKLEAKGDTLVFTEQDGIDYAPATVQTQGGRRVPFLFTVKNLVAEGKGTSFEKGFTMGGKFTVPSYRTGLFLDPKGRGTTTGYDQAVALPAMQAGGDEAMFKENNKKFEVLDGEVKLQVISVNKELGEIGGVFVQQQASDTDLGSKTPDTLQLKGTWFATVE
jgi:photosystem II oxygen-evolving enhancer protein 1